MDYIVLKTVLQSMKLFLRQCLKQHLKSVQTVAFSEKNYQKVITAQQQDILSVM